MCSDELFSQKSETFRTFALFPNMQEYIAKHYLQRHEEVLMRKYEQDLPVYTSDPVRYLVNYQKSRMINWTGLMHEDYCIPDDTVFDVFMKQFAKDTYPETCNYTRKHKVLSDINAQAIRELRQERVLPDCKVWSGSTSDIPVDLLKLLEDSRKSPIPSNMFKSVVIAYSLELYGYAIVEHGLQHDLLELFVQPEHRKNGYGCVLLKTIREQFHPLQIRCKTDSEIAYFQEHAKREFVQFIMD